MSMDLEVKTFSCAPEYLIAGTTIRITTAVKEAAADLEKGAPVLLNASGKAAKVTASGGSVTTTGLYGIVADSAASGEDVVIYLTGEFFADALTLEEDVTAADLEVAFRDIGIFLK
jgi:hypothetical protein